MPTPKLTDASQKDFPVSIEWTRGIVGFPYRLARHREIEIQYIKRGDCSYFISGKHYPVEQNSLLIIQPYESHNFVPKADGWIEKCSLVFPPSVSRPNRDKLRFSLHFPHHLKLAENESSHIDILLNLLTQELTQGRPDAASCFSKPTSDAGVISSPQSPAKIFRTASKGILTT